MQVKVKLFSVLFSLITLMSFGATNDNASSLFRRGSMKDISKMSKAEGKPIMVYVSGDYCGQSEKMNDVMTRRELVKYFSSKYVCKRMDVKNILNQIKASEWGVTSIPTYVFMTPKGRIVHISHGYKKSEKMVEEGEKALSFMKDSNNKME